MSNHYSNCLLCHDAPCSKACHDFDPERLIRALRFDNTQEALSILPESCPEDAILDQCEAACLCDIDLHTLAADLYAMKEKAAACCASDSASGQVAACCTSGQASCSSSADSKPDLSCDICGIKIENPFLLSSSVVGSNYEMIARAFEMGWAGVAFKTISAMEMHEASPRFDAPKNADHAFSGFKNIEQLSTHTVEENMEIIRRLKADYPNKLLIASIMGRNEGEWEYIAKCVTEAGADIVELNFSCPNMEEKGVGVDIGLDPELCRRFTAAARRGTKAPILAKMTPNISDMRIPARGSIEGGADGIAAINTIKSITSVDVDSFSSAPDVAGKSAIGGYSGRAVKPIALRFIAELGQDPEIGKYHLSGMGGVYTWKDAVEFMLLGASSIQITTAIMEYGYRIIDDLISGLEHYMRKHGYHSVNEFIGKSLSHIVDTSEMERDTILFPVFDPDSCAGCGRCYLSCRDGGHQAIRFDSESRRPVLIGSKCVGCHLCRLVCPKDAIGIAQHRIIRKS